MSVFGLSVVLAAVQAAATVPSTGAAVPSSSPSPSATPSSAVATPTLGRYQRSASAQALLTPRDAPELTLADALRIATGAPTLVEAEASTAAAWARADEARAPILPQLNGVANYTRQTGNYAPRPSALPTCMGTMTSGCLPAGSGNLTVNNTDKNYNYFNFGLTLSQFIWDFGVTTDRWRASKANARAVGLTEKTASQTLTLNVRTAYFMARTTRELADVARETFADQEKHLVQIEGGVRVGQRPLIDLYTGRSSLATAESQLITAENNYATAKAQLALAAGMDGPQRFDIPAEEVPAIDGEDETTEELLPEAEKARPDLQALLQQQRAQKLTISSAKGAYGPSLGAAFSLTDAGVELNNLAWNWNVSVTATWSLFSGLLTYSQVKEQKHNLTIVDNEVRAMRQQIRFDVEQARLAVVAARANSRATQDALDNARAQLKLAEGRYAQGLGNIVELTDAQSAATTAAGTKAQADLSLAIARSQLLRALGRT